MTSVLSSPRQIIAKATHIVSVINTSWIYPEADVEYALRTTSYSYRRVGNVIICKTITDVIGIATNIYQRTEVTQPLGNAGYALGQGTFLRDLGKEFILKLETGDTVIKYRLFQQISPQTNPPIISPGSPAVDTPNLTVGYGVIFTAFGTDAGNAGPLFYLDPVRFTRVG